jgi:SAM-dependent methyltransferase
MRADHYELDAALAESHWWWVARRKVIAHLMDRIAGPTTERNVLEVGCSTGSNLSMLQRYGTVQAMEMHAPAVAYGRRQFPDLRIHQAAIPTPLDEHFDIVCLFDVLEHIADEAEALTWIDGHLGPGGLFFLTVPAYGFLWSRHDELAHHQRRYTRGSLVTLLRRSFEVRYATYFNTHLFPAIAGVRIAQRAFGIRGGERDKAIGGKGFVNALLQAIFAAERLWLPRMSLPFGVSIFVAAQKRGPD